MSMTLLFKKSLGTYTFGFYKKVEGNRAITKRQVENLKPTQTEMTCDSDA